MKVPPMEPSAKERIDETYETWNSDLSEPDIEVLHIVAMERAHRDGYAAGVRDTLATREQEIVALTAALKNLMKIGPRPWAAPGKVTWPEWEGAYAAADAALRPTASALAGKEGDDAV